ncbi:hypothetical protein EES42_20025 [Streptomyces sp. ADI95-17]|nr:hypothetical protein EES42_20025 [Streptomyces sp. ADI95-17]
MLVPVCPAQERHPASRLCRPPARQGPRIGYVSGGTSSYRSYNRASCRVPPPRRATRLSSRPASLPTPRRWPCHNVPEGAVISGHQRAEAAIRTRPSTRVPAVHRLCTDQVPGDSQAQSASSILVTRSMEKPQASGRGLLCCLDQFKGPAPDPHQKASPRPSRGRCAPGRPAARGLLPPLKVGAVDAVEVWGLVADGDELVSSEASDDAVTAAPGGEAFGVDGQGDVPGGVAVGVVEVLEVVEVGSARVPGILNVGKPEPACQLMAAAVPRAGSGLGSFVWISWSLVRVCR